MVTSPASSTNGNSNSPLTDVPDVPDVPDAPKSKRSFCARIASVCLMVIPYIVTHIGSGAVKGLELGVTKPLECLNGKGRGMGKPDSKLSKFCGHAGTFAGAIVGTVVAVPSLLLGAVFGIIRSIYNIPSAVKTCWRNDVRTTLSQTINSYGINQRKVEVAACTLAIVAVGAALTAGITIVTPLALTVAVVAPPCFIGILTAVFTQGPFNEESTGNNKAPEKQTSGTANNTDTDTGH